MERIATPITELLGKSHIHLVHASVTTGNLRAIRAMMWSWYVVSGGFDSSAQLKEYLTTARKSLSIPDGEPIPVGVGFIGWILDKTEASPDPRLPTVLAEKPAAIWLAFGASLAKYVRQIREFDAQRTDGHRTLIFMIVNDVEGALRAAGEWGVDVLVAQGIEAGGHGGSEALPLLSLVPAIRAAFPPGTCPPIVAAGGVSTGAQIAALLVLGASGVALGTRFLYTHESCYTKEMKEVLVDATWGATTRGLMFDEVNGTMGWPPKHNGRAIANRIVEDWEAGLALSARLERFEESKGKGEKDRLVIWAGVGVGMTDEIRALKDVFEELHSDAVKALRMSSSLLA
ncbi:hypothetical protein CCMSSC00406_0007335 [Pleurotus cornucopiae]|uniref:Uncharacterized protein n=1 Tax=Pleurotus cornucopiae TaxID=5321 RepID=A0ACB7IU73_PLECO|nr:hypothetical protein CCMSSC00406_0007335 [Pleurotus cornucopiae]